MAALPYVTAPGNIEKALLGIKSAATPERVAQDFVKTILKIPGGSGSQITSYLRKIGFVNADGSPSDIYKKFRNSGTAGKAVAKALRIGYAALYVRNEYMHELPDAKLKGLIIEETGQGEDANIVSMILSAIKSLKKYADFSTESTDSEAEKTSVEHEATAVSPQLVLPQQKLGFNLSYTINLNLPATSDIAVFNAIFKSLKENLLKGEDGS
ncbi:MAG: DUF5343 domain-containing protein [Methylotenera sp.]|nr:DUF5343 domain-containing protein [Methylotenera sp.]